MNVDKKSGYHWQYLESIISLETLENSLNKAYTNIQLLHLIPICLK